MALSCKQGVLTLNTSTGNQSITGVGFQPKAIIFKTVNMGGDGTNPDMQGSFGIATASGQRAMTWVSEDSVSTDESRRGWSDYICFYWLIPGGSSIDFEVSFVSMDSDGFTINVINAPTPGVKVMYLALGGDDITNVEDGYFDLNSGTGDQAITGLSDQPDFLLLFGTYGTASSGATNSDVECMIGFASGPDNEASSAWCEDDGVSTTAADRIQRTDYIYTMMNAPSGVDALAKLKSFDSNGFTLTKDQADNSHRVQYLAITGAKWHVDSFLSQTGTGNFNVTGTGFTPQGALFQSILNPASTDWQTDARLMIGMASDSSNRGVRGTSAKDNVSTTQCFSFADSDKIYNNYSVDESFDASIDFVSWGSDGMTLNQVDADSTANQIIYFAVGPTVEAGGKGSLISAGIVKDGLIGGRLIS